MAENKKILRIADEPSNLAPGQICIQGDPDAKAGARLLGWKDHAGVTHKALAQDSPAHVSNITVAELSGQGAGLAGVNAQGRPDTAVNTLANLNDYITDATLDNAGSTRPPELHGSTHRADGSDPVELIAANISDFDVAVSNNTEVFANTSARHDRSHGLGSTSDHTSTTLAALNGLVSDATLDDAGASRTPTAHANSHKKNGADAIALDLLAEPTDTPFLNATTAAHGLLPKLSGVATQYLGGDGSWSEPQDTTLQQAYDAGSTITIGPSDPDLSIGLVGPFAGAFVVKGQADSAEGQDVFKLSNADGFCNLDLALGKAQIYCGDTFDLVAAGVAALRGTGGIKLYTNDLAVSTYTGKDLDSYIALTDSVVECDEFATKFGDGVSIVGAINQAGTSGEANTASNLGAGAGVFAAKVSEDLRFKSLVEGEYASIVADADTLTISAILRDFDGCVVERQDTFVVVDGGVTYAETELLGGGDLPIQFGGERYLLDCTTGAGVGGRARVALTSGVDTDAQFNFVYVDLNGAIPELKSSTFPPSGEYAYVAFVTVWSSARTAVDGPKAHQRNTDAVTMDGRGRIAYISDRVRQEGTKWLTGVTVTPTITPNAGVIDTVSIENTIGQVFQMHPQIFPPLNTLTDGVYVGNASGNGALVNDQKITNIAEVLEDSSGVSLSGDRFVLTFWGAVNKNTSECKLFVNLPSGGYSSDADAYGDVNGTADTSAPMGSGGTAFLIGYWPLRHQTLNGGTWTSIPQKGGPDFVSKLGTPMGGLVSGGGGGGSSTFAALLDTLVSSPADGQAVFYDAALNLVNRFATPSDIVGFDASVTSNVDVAANTAARHAEDHKLRHQVGGADALALDTLAAATDNTNLNATTLAHGLLPKLSGSPAEFLTGAGTWSAAGGGGSTFASLDDTDIVTPQDGQLPFYNASLVLTNRSAVAADISNFSTAVSGQSDVTANTAARHAENHNTRHQAGGADALAIDTLAAATDNTTLDTTTSAHGLAPKLSGSATEYLNGLGVWATPPGGAGTFTGLIDTDVTDPADGEAVFYNASLDLVNRVITATDVSDFQAAVTTNTAVAQNTADRHTHSNKIILDAVTAAYTTVEAANLTTLSGGGDTTLHYHTTDRNRANHSGTQVAATISDFAAAVTANTTVAANTAARHAENHNTRHKSGGADELPIDTLGAATDNTNLDTSALRHGLAPKLSGIGTEYLNGAGAWATPPVGATTVTGLTDTGIVDPQDDQGFYLDGGVWVNRTVETSYRQYKCLGDSTMYGSGYGPDQRLSELLPEYVFSNVAQNGIDSNQLVTRAGGSLFETQLLGALGKITIDFRKTRQLWPVVQSADVAASPYLGVLRCVVADVAAPQVQTELGNSGDNITITAVVQGDGTFAPSLRSKNGGQLAVGSAVATEQTLTATYTLTSDDDYIAVSLLGGAVGAQLDITTIAQEVSTQRPKGIILLCGANDFGHDLTELETQQALEFVRSQCKERDCELWLVGMLPRYVGTYSRADALALHAIERQQRRIGGDTYIDTRTLGVGGYSLLPGVDSGDGVHPSAEGQDALGEIIGGHLKGDRAVDTHDGLIPVGAVELGSVYTQSNALNRLPYSEDFAKGSWTKTGVSVNSVTGEASPLTSDYSGIESTATGTAMRYILGTVAEKPTSPIVSAWVKKGVLDWCALWCWIVPEGGSVKENQRIWFDLSNGVVGSAEGTVTGTIEEAGDGYLVRAYHSAANSDAYTAYVIPCDGDASLNSTSTVIGETLISIAGCWVCDTASDVYAHTSVWREEGRPVLTPSALTVAADEVLGLDDAISGNTTVSANTAARHAAVTVQDTATVDLTLAGQLLQAAVLPSGLDLADLGGKSHTDLTDIGTNTHTQIDTHIAATNNPHGVTATQVSLGSVTDDAQLKRAAGDFATFTAKATPVDNDVILIEDSAASGAKKKITVGDLPSGGGTGGALATYSFFADQMRSPTNADWDEAVNAPLATDGTNAALMVRSFDDTAVEAAGMDIYIPAGATDLVLTTVHRAASTGGLNDDVVLNLHSRTVQDDAVMGAWSTDALNTLEITNDSGYWQIATQTITLSTLGLSAETNVQLQISRNGASVSDTLSGDWLLYALVLEVE